ncbi:MAG: two-component regulator propeller domain-containing protein [Candidatus Kapaibacterium sp.]
MKNLAYLVLLVVMVVPLTAQIRLDNWKTHTSMYTVNATTTDGNGNIWSATSGGVFRYSLVSKEIQEFRNIDALLSLSNTAIGYNAKNKSMYVGSDDGVIDVIDSQLQFRHITDIRNQATLTKRRINDFLFMDSTVYVAGDFGIISFDLRDAPGDDIRKLGSFQPNTPVLKLAVLNDTLWAITPTGLAGAPLAATSLRNPQVWNTFTAANGLLENGCLGLAVVRGKLYIAHSTGIVCYDKGIFTPVIKDLKDFGIIRSFGASADSLYYVDIFSLFSIDTDGNRAKLNTNPQPEFSGISVTADGTLFTRFPSNGMAVVRNGITEVIKLNTPYSNLFLSLTVDTKGALWSATDAERSGGFTQYANGSFTNYIIENYPQLVTNGYFKISALPDGSVWAGNWGAGIAKIENDTAITVYNTTNSELKPIAADISGKYVLAGEAAADRKGNVWITNFKNDNPGPVIVVKTTTNQWYGYTSGLIDKHSYPSIVIDNSGTKWLGSYDGDGLVYFNEKSTFSDQSDDVWGRLTSSNSSLSSNIINGLAIDKNGALWIATSEGVCVMYAPSGALRGTNPSVQKLSALSTEVINDITVDALNQKWVATNTGVYILNEDGTAALGSISTKNSPLVSDQVRSLVLDDASGIAYLGTADGLSEVRTLSVRPRDEYSVECYPQPFNPARDGELVIEGLAAESSIRILTVDGQLIRALDTKSRKTIWDGRTETGELAPTGVYLVRVNSMLDTSSSAVAKIAVVRP